MRLRAWNAEGLHLGDKALRFVGGAAAAALQITLTLPFPIVVVQIMQQTSFCMYSTSLMYA